MKFLILFVTAFGAVNYVSARVAGWPTVPLPEETINLTFSSGTTDDFEIIIPSDSKTSIDDITFTPPVMFIGKSNGEMLRCVNQRCMTFNTARHAITSLVVVGEYIFAGLASGVMWRCSLHIPNSCTNFNEARDPINALTYTGGHIYAGLNSGKILKCELVEPDSCSNFITLDHAVTSLGASDKYLFAGLKTGPPVSCAKDGNNCTTLNIGQAPVTALAVKGDYIYASTRAKVVKHCNTISSLYCTDWNITDANIKSLSIFNKTVFVATDSSFLSCKLGAWNACSEIGNMTGVLSIANIYGTFDLQSRVKNENKQCSWQPSQYPIIYCPPYVVYYDLKQRLMFELSIRDGKVYNANGILFDSTQADFKYSSQAAIFVMAPNGQIFASNNNRKYLLHESSLLAGSPVSAAGEMIVEQGVIKKVTACSKHYRPDLELNNQLIESLYMKGYTRKFESISCPVQIHE